MTPPKHDRAAAQMTDAWHDRIAARYVPLIAAALRDVSGLRKAITEALADVDQPRWLIRPPPTQAPPKASSFPLQRLLPRRRLVLLAPRVLPRSAVLAL